jgi:hypothetical protein
MRSAYDRTLFYVASSLATPFAAALEVIRSLGDQLVEVDVEGWRAWLPADDAEPIEPRGDGAVHLLPHFDCYVVGSFPRERLIPAIAPPELQRGTAAPFRVLLVDGVVAGLWQRRPRGRVLEVRAAAFAALDDAKANDVVRQAHRVGQILEADTVDCSFGDVEPKGHL